MKRWEGRRDEEVEKGEEEKKGERERRGKGKAKDSQEKRRILAPQTNSLPVSSGMQKKELVVSAHPSVFRQQLFCIDPKMKRREIFEGQVQIQVSAEWFPECLMSKCLIPECLTLCAINSN